MADERGLLDAASSLRRSHKGGLAMNDKHADSTEHDRFERQIEQIRQYAWDWFSYHAKQRTDMFNYSLAAAGLLAAAYATVLDKSTLVAAGIGVVGMFVTLCFIFLDKRNHQLVDYGQNVLKAVETHMFAAADVPESRLAKLGMPLGIHRADPVGQPAWRNVWDGRHRIFLQLVEIFMFVVFLAGALVAYYDPGIFAAKPSATEKELHAVAENLKSIGDKLGR